MPKTRKNQKFTYESLQDSNSIVTYLNSLAEGIGTGRLRLSTNGDDVVLEPQGLLKFSIKGKRESGRCELSIKVQWRDDEPVHSGDAAPLRVTPGGA